MKKRNQGYAIEEYMKKWFRGFYYPTDCVDFQTKTTFYEVKSCKLIVDTYNRNDRRKFREKRHRRIRSHQLGRFVIKRQNHEALKKLADQENRLAKYIFVVVIGKQKAWRVYTWDIVEKIISEKKGKHIRLTIKEVFEI